MSRGAKLALMTVVALVMVGGSAGGAALVSASPAKLRVTPRNGTKRTAFTLTFTPPRATGSADGIQSAISITAGGPRSTHGCVARLADSAAAARAGAAVHVRLSPGGKGWCAGTFRGEVTESGRPVCKPGRPCPEFIVLTPIGSFRFVVRRTATRH